ncbi:MAG: hypothetical protein PHT94_04800 [Candidatus Nanoarchaeia archaeon]|nr:hypothetical protein [Candidatus Nanoarchaeia archaeon]
MISDTLLESISLVVAVIAIIAGLGIYSGFFNIFTSNDYQQCISGFERMDYILSSVRVGDNFNYFFTQNENECVMRFYNSSYTANDKPCKEGNCLVLFKKRGMKLVPDKIKKYEDITINYEGKDMIDFSSIQNKIIEIKSVQDMK